MAAFEFATTCPLMVPGGLAGLRAQTLIASCVTDPLFNEADRQCCGVLELAGYVHLQFFLYQYGKMLITTSKHW